VKYSQHLVKLFCLIFIEINEHLILVLSIRLHKEQACQLQTFPSTLLSAEGGKGPFKSYSRGRLSSVEFLVRLVTLATVVDCAEQLAADRYNSTFVPSRALSTALDIIARTMSGRSEAWIGIEPTALIRCPKVPYLARAHTLVSCLRS
jgi:hypothetical protein